ARGRQHGRFPALHRAAMSADLPPRNGKPRSTLVRRERGFDPHGSVTQRPALGPSYQSDVVSVTVRSWPGGVMLFTHPPRPMWQQMGSYCGTSSAVTDI